MECCIDLRRVKIALVWAGLFYWILIAGAGEIFYRGTKRYSEIG